MHIILVSLKQLIGEIDNDIQGIEKLVIILFVLQIGRDSPPVHHGEEEMSRRVIRSLTDEIGEFTICVFEFQIVDILDPPLHSCLEVLVGKSLAGRVERSNERKKTD